MIALSHSRAYTDDHCKFTNFVVIFFTTNSLKTVMFFERLLLLLLKEVFAC